VREKAASSTVPARAALAALLAALAVCMAAPSAQAVIVHLRGGKALSFQPLRGASAPAAPLDAFFSNLDYNGGPVMASNTNYAIYWQPSGAPAYPTGYRSGVDTYFEDLAHDSGGRQNVDSVSSQYNDWEGDFARYDSHFGGDLLDTDPYPANGCKQATICLTDEQLEQELEKFIEANKLPTDIEHEYFLLTPPTVEDCFEAGGAECSAGTKKPAYCAYHSAFSSGTGVVVYANDPYVTGNFGCDDGNHPNGKPSDGVIEGGLSHEHNESVTDPEPNSGWTDLGGSGGEIGDKCRTFESSSEFGPTLGTTGSGAKYNQVINGHFYWYQQEWSNEDHECLQRWSPGGAPATATFSSEPAAGANEMKFNASASTAPGGVVKYNWKFAGAGTPTETSVPTISHKFPGSGKWEVALTVFASNGESAGTTRLIATGDEGPVAAFSPSATFVAPGQPVAFAAEASDPDGSITAYEWNFGDGSTRGTGAAPSHAYAAGGTYTVTLLLADSSGQIATTSHVIEVDEAPSAEFSFAPTAARTGSAVAFNAAASSDADGSIASYAWSFGDGGAATGVAPEHVFTAPGSYAVTLTVTDSDGRTAGVTHEVTVTGAPAGSAAGASGTPGTGSPSAAPGAAAVTAAAAGKLELTASVDPASGAITFTAAASGAGTFSWLSTFANGRFGVFGASVAKCRRGFVRLHGRCRPAAIVFSKGRKAVASLGAVKLLLRPTASGRRALASAWRHRRGLPVKVTLSFQPASGGAAVSRSFSIVVRGAKPKKR
jgi:PKD repeat protein